MRREFVSAASIAMADVNVVAWIEHLEPHEWITDPMDAFLLASFGPTHFDPIRIRYTCEIPYRFYCRRPSDAEFENYLRTHREEHPWQ